jgi:hypothetical protein
MLAPIPIDIVGIHIEPEADCIFATFIDGGCGGQTCGGTICHNILFENGRCLGCGDAIEERI